jgi:carboxypeptidase Taq
VGFFVSQIFAMRISDEMKGYLDELGRHRDELDLITGAMYRKAKKVYDVCAMIPVDKMREFSELRVKSELVWEDAKKDNDFKLFAPYLKKVIAAQKELLAYRKSDVPMYNLLLDDYEEGLTMDVCDEFFAKLKAGIVPLLKNVMAKSVKAETGFKHIKVPIDKQREISEFIANKIGYDLNCGLIRESAHPFCNSNCRDDVRITTHYHENDFMSSMYGVLHECGHAIYEQKKKDEIANTYLDRGISMGIHESQSRFYENVIGRSLQFWEYITDELKAYLPDGFKDVTPEMFCAAANEAKPSLIRIEADELTYCLHIMLRYEIERMMFDDGKEFDVDDLPRIWNEKFEEYFGIRPPNDTKGVLQDIHWSNALMGYFPSYAIGSAYAAQFLAYMEREMDVYAHIKKGDFMAITAWLTKHIHQHGSIYTPSELVGNIAGEQLNADYYIAYLTKKFGGAS